MRAKIHLNDLMEIVRNGGVVRTGVDIYNREGVLLLEQDQPVSALSILENLKRNGVTNLLINPGNRGGVWNRAGDPVSFEPEDSLPGADPPGSFSSVEKKIREIEEIRAVAGEKYKNAKNCIVRVIDDIRASGGTFDFSSVEKTASELLDFLVQHGNAFSYLTKELFSYDDYLYTHAINVCTIGCGILSRFNSHFSQVVDRHLGKPGSGGMSAGDGSFSYFLPQELHHIATGFFLHDIGKVMIPGHVLNKNGRLTEREFGLVKTHSYLRGEEILAKNGCNNPYVLNSVKYHHAVLFPGEAGCYPDAPGASEVPVYVKICKIADIYDAMTSKRSYKDPVNPIGVVTDIFRSFAGHDNMLQFVLHSFVESIGIYPPGSIASLKNGQFVYVLDSRGPLVLPFTDGEGRTLRAKADPLDLGEMSDEGAGRVIDKGKPLISPRRAYDSLPDFLK